MYSSQGTAISSPYLEGSDSFNFWLTLEKNQSQITWGTCLLMNDIRQWIKTLLWHKLLKFEGVTVNYGLLSNHIETLFLYTFSKDSFSSQKKKKQKDLHLCQCNTFVEQSFGACEATASLADLLLSVAPHHPHHKKNLSCHSKVPPAITRTHDCQYYKLSISWHCSLKHHPWFGRKFLSVQLSTI